MMFNAKYEEDSSISSKVMANSIFEIFLEKLNRFPQPA